MTPPIVFELPERLKVTLTDLVLDFTGTLSLDGELISGVAQRIKTLSQQLRITVLTADTFGTAAKTLQNLPVAIKFISTGKDKVEYVNRLKAEHVVAIGNGKNDVGMIKTAFLGIAVIGPEGASGELVRAAKVVVQNINDALDLLLNPLRLKATLRE